MRRRTGARTWARAQAELEVVVSAPAESVIVTVTVTVTGQTSLSDGWIAVAVDAGGGTLPETFN